MIALTAIDKVNDFRVPRYSSVKYDSFFNQRCPQRCRLGVKLTKNNKKNRVTGNNTKVIYGGIFNIMVSRTVVIVYWHALLV